MAMSNSSQHGNFNKLSTNVFTNKHYYEPLAHCSLATAPNLIEVIPESLKMQYLGSDPKSSPNEQWSIKRS